MATNRFFCNSEDVSEQDLFEDLVIEMIQMSGSDVTYIPREDFIVDDILQFKSAYPFKYSKGCYELGDEYNGSGCKSGSMEIGNRTRCYYGWR